MGSEISFEIFRADDKAHGAQVPPAAVGEPNPINVNIPGQNPNIYQGPNNIYVTQQVELDP
jgi:hypothetical protein